MVFPDIRHRQGNVLGKSTGAINANATGMGAEMAAACHAVAAAAADYMALAGDYLPFLEGIHIGANINNFADKFMANNHRHWNSGLGPFVPVINVHVSATNCRALYFNQHIINTDCWLRHIFQPQPDSRIPFDQCFHAVIFLIFV